MARRDSLKRDEDGFRKCGETLKVLSNSVTPPRIIGMILIAWAAHMLANLSNFALGIMLPDISRDMALGIEEGGWLSSSAWIVRFIITIPVALTITFFNEKKFLGMVFVTMGLGMLLQGIGTNFAELLIGRGLVMGAAAAIFTPLVFIKIRWIPVSKMGIVNGIETFTGPAGQILGTVAIPFMITYFMDGVM